MISWSWAPSFLAFSDSWFNCFVSSAIFASFSSTAVRNRTISPASASEILMGAETLREGIISPASRIDLCHSKCCRELVFCHNHLVVIHTRCEMNHKSLPHQTIQSNGTFLLDGCEGTLIQEQTSRSKRIDCHFLIALRISSLVMRCYLLVLYKMSSCSETA